LDITWNLNISHLVARKYTEHKSVLFPISTLAFLKLVITLTPHPSHTLQCIDGLQDLMAESIFMSHIPLSELPNDSARRSHTKPGISALLAPATVVIQLYFSPSISDNERDVAETNIRGLIEHYVYDFLHAVDSDGLIAVGWSVENDVSVMSAERNRQVGKRQQGDGMKAAVYGILVGWGSETAAGMWRRGSSGIEFLAQAKCLPGVLAIKIETVELRCHHNLVRRES